LLGALIDVSVCLSVGWRVLACVPISPHPLLCVIRRDKGSSFLERSVNTTQHNTCLANWLIVPTYLCRAGGRISQCV